MTDDLLKSLEQLAGTYPKPASLQDVWSDDSPGEVAPYKALHALDWSDLADEPLRRFGFDVALMNADAWAALMPNLMISALRRPYLVWEYDGTLVQEMLNHMQAPEMSTAPHILDGLSRYSAAERSVVIDWLRWSAEQTPNMTKKSDDERERYLDLRRSGHQIAIDALSALPS